MVEIADCPAGRIVAVIAGGTGRDVIRMLAGGNVAIMTGLTSTGDTFVGKVIEGPVIGGVTGFARGCGLDMAGMLTGRDYTVMA
jgi:hypothetical protein